MQWSFMEWPTLWGHSPGMGYFPNPVFLVGAESLGFLRTLSSLPQHTGIKPLPQLASCMILPSGPQAPT